ncbi:hypothetical protein CP97_03875 [Aurantiacibacter atlanticus]|uniref:Putative Flp pilus-assembly TadG-like N-terminal domain-containing protein n=1 Tax=Aurantiacibacter atlanticus TaxID=1648404 RepID=A0A0H4V9Q4_9SPHN|nr:TadE/TadG family type IV pilus assembly protein [Aurantiacibacter atlanticus]AKQ41357.1 hypothetical protein CP97_03875 [Aurantiacibacter atlanticus]
MSRRSTYLQDQSGAVAATYAIAITGLIIVAGAAFDYNRIMSLDSEMQTAADQAALAGVTQLDKTDGACARAGNAAVELLRNITLLSNDSMGNAVTVNGGTTISIADDSCGSFNGITFYEDSAKTSVAATDESARFVEVIVDQRSARYSFTAIGGLIESPARGQALAGLGTAICRVPPLMICNPTEPSNNTDPYLEFDVDNNIGAGVKLVGNESYEPGAFGFLETSFGTGANGLKAALGWDVRGGDCTAVDGVEVKNGLNASVMDAINTRFDLPGNGNNCPSINGISGTCSPSVNVRKDFVRQQNNSNWSVYQAGSAANAHLNAYRPTSTATYATLFGATAAPAIMGHPRDLCHAWNNDGDCAAHNGGQSARMGTGDWDINAYWLSNFGANYAGQVSALTYGAQPKGYPTRYQVYRWEADQMVAGTLPGIAKNVSGNTYAYAQPQPGRSLALPNSPYGLVPGSQSDRRRLSVAVLNCTALTTGTGHNNLNNRELAVGSWIDVFMVEPAIARKRCQSGNGCNVTYTEAFDVYAEVIGRTDIGGDNGSSAQTIRRDLPRLIE